MERDRDGLPPRFVLAIPVGGLIVAGVLAHCAPWPTAAQDADRVAYFALLAWQAADCLFRVRSPQESIAPLPSPAVKKGRRGD